MKSSTLRRIPRCFIALALLLSLLGPAVIAQGRATTPPRSTEYFTVETVVMDDGKVVDKAVISGPPERPAGYEYVAVEPGKTSKADSVVILTAPAFSWSFGCSATSAAMIAGYYDRGSYPNMYAGPTNGGVMPLDNSSWPDWVDSGGDTRHQCPLSATHNGLDGRGIRGAVDDYWVYYGHGGPDPYETNGWTEHTLSDCTGDFMKTNRAATGNSDGSTMFYNYNDGSPLTAADMEGYGIDDEDGGYGFKLFYESRGYAVTTMYNQRILGQGTDPTKGFTFAQYKAEIDAGRPVMIHLEGHTMVGVGYDDSSNTMYIHDTWDYNTYTMTWNGTYGGMQHYAVTIVQLQVVAPPPNAPTNLTATAVSQHQINLAWTDNSTNESGFKIERSPFAPGSWVQIATVGAGVQTYPNTGLASGTTYYYRVRAWNAQGDSAYSNEAHATTFTGSQYWMYLPVVVKGYLEGGACVLPIGEGFEAGVPPAGWTRIQLNPRQTWKTAVVGTPHSGSHFADVEYDDQLALQDEVLLSPPFTANSAQLSFYSKGSPYWCRDTYDNCDFNIWLVVGDWGSGGETFVREVDQDWTGTFVWSLTTINLTPYLPAGTPVRVAFHYYGLDGAQVGLDDVSITGTCP